MPLVWTLVVFSFSKSRFEYCYLPRTISSVGVVHNMISFHANVLLVGYVWWVSLVPSIRSGVFFVERFWRIGTSSFDLFVFHGDLVWVFVVNWELGLCWILVKSQVPDWLILCLKKVLLHAPTLSREMQIVFTGCCLYKTFHSRGLFYCVIKLFIREDQKGFWRMSGGRLIFISLIGFPQISCLL